MQYRPAVIPTAFADTRAGLLWSAANIAVAEPGVDDVIAEAARRAGAHGTPAHADADARAVEIARSRVPAAPLNPAWPPNTWRTWQAAIDETWPILADAAESKEWERDRHLGLVPGRWEA